MTITGGCLCGGVRYESEGDIVMAGHCQCTDCRKTSGSAHRSMFAVPRAGLKMSGALKGYESKADSGNMVTREFCPNCGSPVLASSSGMPGMAMIAASTLDDPEVFKPQLAVYTSRGPSWDLLSPDIPGFKEMPPNMT